MKLYNLPHSPFAARVRIQIYKKQLDIEMEVPASFGTEEYRLINPTGKIPALDTGTMVLPESSVIMRYLEDCFPETPMLPSEPGARARANLFLRFADVTIQPALLPIFSQVFTRSDDNAALAEKFTALREVLILLNSLMQQYQWGNVGAGEYAIDLADCALAPVLYYCDWLAELFEQSLAVDKLGQLNDWWAAAQADPSVARVLAEISQGLVAMQARLANT